MCGIYGSINVGNQNFNKIIKSLIHRGPDDQNHLKYGNLDLIQTRLAIQDLENGKQPLEIGDYLIIFNGEIYNHLELRKKIS